MSLRKYCEASFYKLNAYIKLMRLDKPIGTLLLLWPTLSALWLAGLAMPKLSVLVVFILGVLVMRSAGCVINDFADRDFDGHVERTQYRPLPQRQVTEREVKLLFGILIFIAFLLALTLNTLTLLLSFIALGLAWIYPLLKRVTYFPQLGLGLAFSWSIPMAYASVCSHLPLNCWLLFIMNILWTIAYDTQYAMVDREDDVRLNIKSTAILFGKYDITIITLLQLTTLLLLAFLGYSYHLNIVYYIGLGLIIGLFFYQFKLLKTRRREAYFKAFKNNNYVGLVLFFGIVGACSFNLFH